MDENIKTVFKNAKAQVQALKADALERRKRQYRDTEAAPENAELDQQIETFVTKIRAENEAKKAANIAKADQKAADEVAKEYGEADKLIGKFLGGE